MLRRSSRYGTEMQLDVMQKLNTKWELDCPYLQGDLDWRKSLEPHKTASDSQPVTQRRGSIPLVGQPGDEGMTLCLGRAAVVHRCPGDQQHQRHRFALRCYYTD